MQNLKIGDAVKLMVDDFYFIGTFGKIMDIHFSRSSQCLVMVDNIKVSVPEHCLEKIDNKEIEGILL
jgi:hypothetical protein